MTCMRRRLYCMLLALLPVAWCQAQDLDRVLPDPVPEQFNDMPEPEQSTDTLESVFDTTLTGASTDEEVLVSRLNRLILIGDEALLEERPSSSGDALTVREVSLLQQALGDGLVPFPYIGQPVSEESLQRLRFSLESLMSVLGKPYSLVYLPPQDITDGVVQVVVKASSLAALGVAGNQYFASDDYLRRLPLPKNAAIDSNALLTGMERINRNPFRQASLTVSPGHEPLTTDILVQVQEQRPWRVFSGINNTGTATTRENRWSTGATWGNVFGRGHVMTLQLSGDRDFRHSRAISGNYTLDLPNADGLTVFGAYSEIQGIVPEPLNQQGKSYQLGVNWDHNLGTATGRFQHGLQFGLDYKYSDNNLDFVAPPVIFPITGSETEIVQGRLAYNASLQDSLGITRGSIALTASPGGLVSGNQDADFANTRAGASADYSYASLTLARDTMLSGWLSGWTWALSTTLQQASGNLLGSEQLSAGGSRGGRGYEEGEIIGDEGLLFTQQLLLPNLPFLSLWLDSMDGREAIRPYLFQDYAKTANVDKLPGEADYELFSVGAGFSYRFDRYVTASLAYGWQLRGSGSSASGKNRAAHFSIEFAY